MLTFAHTRSDRAPSTWQLLEEHLQRVGDLASRFAPPDLQSLALTAGRWHDLGKYQSAFQLYLGSQPEASNESNLKFSSVPHSAAGAALALERFSDTDARALLLALAIEAHHGALKSSHAIFDVTRQRGMPLLEAARRGGVPAELELESPTSPRTLSALAVRMLFSSLIDADLLDTEQWDRGYERAANGDSLPALRDLVRATCEARIADSATRAGSPAEHALADMRREVYKACVISAAKPTGAFTLTVPTGGGKTLSGLAFALHHAVEHGLRRVIVVAPYTSILEQTARVYRQTLGEHNVLEHHSNLTPTQDTDRNRQASENWDAPVIVTTNVQLLESLHAAHKRPCRKLHRIAQSVILLDEVQTFPVGLLQPIHAVLKRLVEQFGTTVVHMTATQPLLTSAKSILNPSVQMSMTEIVPEPERHFASVRNRFTMERLGDLRVPLAPKDLAVAVGMHPTALVITHRREDAADLAELLGHDCLHLSAAMCAEHRTVVLDEARRRLLNGKPCLLVATQLIEAGVDIDFPIVFRALAGLETLAQAAGRCNRELRLSSPGRFLVYRAGKRTAEGTVVDSPPPPGSPRLGRDVALTYFEGTDPDLQDPHLFPAYARRVFKKQETDQHGLLKLEDDLDFPAVAEHFRMIDEATISVVAPYGEAHGLVAELRRSGPTRDGFRTLQRFTVGLRERQFGTIFAAGWLEPVFEPGRDSTRFETLWTLREGASDVYDLRFGFYSKDGKVALRPLIA
jgi:CRISPR-associated endonuclease/helicase Cas3